MSFLLRMFLTTIPTLLAMALLKPGHANVTCEGQLVRRQDMTATDDVLRGT